MQEKEEKKKKEAEPASLSPRPGQPESALAQAPSLHPAVEFLIIAISGCAPRREDGAPGRR